MTTKQLKQLLRAASEAGSSGQRWTAFWREHEDHVRAAERHHTLRFRRLVNRLIAAWAKAIPQGAPPWLTNEARPEVFER